MAAADRGVVTSVLKMLIAKYRLRIAAPNCEARET
jgi:hypothetical protein